jgi:hypothetical protein
VTRVLLYASAAVVLGAFGFALGARAPSAALLDTTTDTSTAPTTTTAPVTTAPVTTAPTTVAPPPPPPPTTTAKTKVKPKHKRQTTTAQTTTAPATTAQATTTQATTTAPPPKKQKRKPVTPAAAVTPTGGDPFPAWAIAGLCLAALLIGGGVTGMVVTRGRR